MQQIRYAAHQNDRLAMLAVEILSEECNRGDPQILRCDEPADPRTYSFFSSSGNFSKRFIREVKPNDAEKRNIITPNFYRFAAKSYAINKTREIAILERDPRFLDSLYQLDLRLARRLGILKPLGVQQIRPPRQWDSGYQARVRRFAS